MKVRVEGYSGYKANERPVRFCLGEQWRDVEEVTDRWYGPDAAYFGVRADDGNFYILKLDENTHEWELSGYRASQR